jgi:chromosome segregation ATPase
MRIVATLVLAAMTTGSALAAEPAKKTPPETTAAAKAAGEASEDSPLVRAAKSGPQNRDKAKIVIDNSTVRKSTGKLTIVSAPIAKPNQKAREARRREARAYDQQKALWEKNRTDSAEKIQRLERELNELESVVGNYEEDFYNEDDPGVREGLEDQYQSSSDRMEKIRQDLARARQEAEEIERSEPRFQ